MTGFLPLCHADLADGEMRRVERDGHAFAVYLPR